MPFRTFSAVLLPFASLRSVLLTSCLHWFDLDIRRTHTMIHVYIYILSQLPQEMIQSCKPVYTIYIWFRPKIGHPLSKNQLIVHYVSFRVETVILEYSLCWNKHYNVPYNLFC